MVGDYTKFSTDRLIRMRRKYRELLYTSHRGGAGGVRDSDQWQLYYSAREAIDKELQRRAQGKGNKL